MTSLLAGGELTGGPPVVFLRNRPLGIRLVGVHGEVYELNDGRSPVRLSRDGTGLGMPTWTAYTTSSPVRAGQVLRGANADPREFVLPIVIQAPTGQEWLELEPAFWRALDPVATVALVVTNPFDGATRTLRARFVDDGGWAPNIDPGISPWTKYAIRMIADQPFWVGDRIRKSFASSTPHDFIDDEGYWLSPAEELGNASISNPGDEPASCVYTITPADGEGGITSWLVGIDGRQVGGEVEVPEGDVITVNTDKTALSVVRADGTSVIDDLAESSFANVPPGTRVPMLFEMDGIGGIVVELDPLYRRGIPG